MLAHVLASGAGGSAAHGPLTGNPWIDLAIIVGLFVGAASGALALLRGPLKRMAAFSRFLGEFRDDWQGVPDRPGVPGRPGIPERLFRVEQEVRPNGGGSMKDAVVAIHEIATRTEHALQDHLDQVGKGGAP